MKKLLGSLMLGFGAALGVFVALAMPPGGWGVAVGVGLGLLGCLPLLLIVMMLVGRGSLERHRRIEYEEAPQPVIIIQHPGGYDPLPEQYYPPRNRMPEPEYYAEPVRPRRVSQPTPEHYQPLPPSRRRTAYYPEEYFSGEEPAYYYDAPAPPPARYDAYYGPRQGYYNEDEPGLRPGRDRRPARLGSRREEAVEADYRTIGDND